MCFRVLLHFPILITVIHNSVTIVSRFVRKKVYKNRPVMEIYSKKPTGFTRSVFSSYHGRHGCITADRCLLRKRRSFNILIMINHRFVIQHEVIQPESIDAVIVVVLLAYVPDIFSCLRIEHVDLNAVTLEIVCLLFRADYPCMFFILLDFLSVS